MKKKIFLSLFAASAISLTFTACDDEITASLLQFEGIDTPITAEEKSAPNASAKSTSLVNGTVSHLTLKKLLSTGDQDNGQTFGLVKDYQDKNIAFADNSPYICNGTNAGVGSGLDYVSFIADQNASVNARYMVSQFECEIGAMYMNQYTVDPTSGEVSVVPNTLEFISQKDYHGGWVHCAGQSTPWNSHLGSEEYEPDAKSVQAAVQADGTTGDKYYDELAKYFGGDATKSNPYYWGWNPEVTITNGKSSYTKHYSMGRFSHELSYVMPDEKTVYMSDDGTNVGLFMFVADKKKDLSAGTLYAAKWKQTSEDGVEGGTANLTWINLGHADDASVQAAVDAKINFSDIMTVTTPAADGSCVTGKAINTSAGAECVVLHTEKYSEAVIARLETRRYAAYKGATTEWRKEEGITFDETHGKLYIAMSSIGKGMEDNQKYGVDNTSYDFASNNDIRLKYNPCGAIYESDIATKSVKDDTKRKIHSRFVINTMNAILTGTPTTYPEGDDFEGNKCSVDGISNPDNVTFLQGTNTLTIGEDTSKHVNNMIWVYDVETEALTRIITVSEGAETTSPFWHDIDKDRSFMSVVTQHPDFGTAENGESTISTFGTVTK